MHALLYVDRRIRRALFRDDLEFLEAVANQLAVRLHNMSEALAPHRRGRTPLQQRPQEEIVLIGSDTHLAGALVLHPTGSQGRAGTDRWRGRHRQAPLAAPFTRPPAAGNAAANLCLRRFGRGHAGKLSLFGRSAADGSEQRPGILELADGGTVLIDDIDQLSPTLQKRLLRVIEQGQVQRQGDASPRQINVRIMSTMAQGLKKSELTPELAQCLETLSCYLPPLRDRHEDFELLVDHFIQDAAQRLDQPVRRLSANARALLLSQAWPGNIRQLRSVIEQAMVVATENIIKEEDLPEFLQNSKDSGSRLGPSPLIPLAEMERRHVLHMLEHCGGNKKAAAELLGIDRSTLYAKLRQYGVH